MYKNIAAENRKNSVKRENYLEILLKNLAEHKLKRGRNLALIGSLNIGKSFIVKEFLTRASENNNAGGGNAVAYVDFSRIGLTPEEFATKLLLGVTSWHLRKEVSSLDDCKLGSETAKIVEQVKNEFLKIKPDHKLLISSALNFAEALSKDKNLRTIVCLDEFWKLLEFNNYEQIKDVLTFFKQIIFAQSHVKYVVIGSAVTLMKEISKKLEFEAVETLPLNSRELAEETGNVKENDELYYYSAGMPLFLNAIKARQKISGCDVKEAFVIEALWKQGIIYHACKDKLDDSLDRARGRGLLLTILNAVANSDKIADSDGLRLSEVSRAIYRSAGVTKNLAERLVKADLLVKESGRFRFNDSVLKYWFKNFTLGNDFEEIPTKNEIRSIEVRL
ncbi:ATP-binding protein [Candidatus Woesearchaeota archaeon]|nr:ATP-binding protein [Candidatus Woesearchaeota archaeon]